MDGRYDLALRELAGRHRRGGPGARDRRPPRRGGRACSRRRRRSTGCAGGCSTPFDGAGAGGVPHVRAARARGRAGASTASIWAFVEGDALPARGDPAPLRRRAPRRRPAVPCCDVCDPALVPAPPGAPVAQRRSRRRAAGRPRRRDPRRRVDAARPGGRAHARRRDPARRALEGRCAATRYDGLPGYGTFDHLTRRRGARARRRAARRRAAALDRRRVSRSSSRRAERRGR